jgi:hypothetical protein
MEIMIVAFGEWKEAIISPMNYMALPINKIPH